MAWEITSEPLAGGPMGTFTPKADQSRFRSAFGVVGGTREPGWPDASTLLNGVPSQDGRGRLKMEPYKGEDGKSVNKFRFNGMELQEFVVPVEDCDAKSRHDGAISELNVRGRIAPAAQPATDSQVGRSSVGESAFVYPVQPAQVAH